MILAELYIWIAITCLLISLVPVAVCFRICRKKKEVLVEMGLQVGLPSSLPSSLPVLVDQQQQLPLAWDSGLPTYEEAMKSRLPDIGLDCQY